jgi:two-component system phosphate regulon response regulator OmpR
MMHHVDPRAAHIMVVDDEPFQRRLVSEYLTRQGFRVSAVEGGAEMRAALLQDRADIVLLDVNMPGEDGFSLARFLRGQGPIGIIMLTTADDMIDRVVGLETGADDYVTKPFEPRELLARIKSLLRRSQMLVPQAMEEPAPVPSTPAESKAEVARIRVGRCLLDTVRRTMSTLEGDDVPITNTEYDLLKVFADNPNRVMTREELLDITSDRELGPFDRSIDIRITRIRKKVEEDAAHPTAIRTARGRGYVFTPDT